MFGGIHPIGYRRANPRFIQPIADADDHPTVPPKLAVPELCFWGEVPSQPFNCNAFSGVCE
jgi:hypothetical protein